MVSASTGGNVIEAEGLTKAYAGRTVLAGVSLSIAEGETVVIIGPSGSGKTTFLRCLNYLETPDGGVVRLRGVPIGVDARHRPLPEAQLAMQRSRIGFVFQRFNLFAHLTALDNVAIGPHRVHHNAFPRKHLPTCGNSCRRSRSSGCPTGSRTSGRCTDMRAR